MPACFHFAHASSSLTLGISAWGLGPSSVGNAGGITPMLSQHDSGSDSATTRSPGAMPIKVVPDKPIVISYEGNVCMLPATFTPQKDMHYLLIAVEGHKPSDPSIPFLQSMMHIHDRQCIVSVVEVDADGQPVKPVKVK